MLREQFREGGDGDIEFVLPILHYKLFGVLLRKSLEFSKGGNGGFVGAWVSQGAECDRIQVYNNVSVLLILECPGGNVGRVLLDQGNYFTLSSVRCRYNSDAVCRLWGIRLERVSTCQ